LVSYDYADGSAEAVQISGFLISDFYYINDAEAGVYSNYKPKMMRQVYTNKRSGFQFRRIYLTFDKKMDDVFSTRIRLEMSNTDYNYSQMTASVKDAYLKWKINSNHDAYFGISGAPAFGAIEKFWGFRHLDKTASDYFGIRSSRDFGVSFKGRVYGGLNYHFFAGNGESNASERSGRIDKLYSLSLSQDFSNYFFYQFYTDYRLSKDGKDDEFTGQVFAGYKNENFRIGFQYTYQENKLMKSEKKGDLQLYSVPVIYKYIDKVSFIFRYSYYIAEEEQNYQQQAFIGGMEYKIRDNILLLPNIIYNDYNFENANNLGKDVITRLTLSYYFK
jgi:hypothetical protein